MKATGRVCTTCNQYKPYDAFPVKRSIKSGYGSKCKICVSKWSANHYKKPHIKLKRISRQGSEENRDKCRFHKIKCTYKLTKEQYNEMLKDQKYTCAICGGKTLSKKFKYLSVDHCHKTGKIRGLLCNRCNSGLGFLKEDARIVKNLLKYIEEVCEPLKIEKVEDGSK